MNLYIFPEAISKVDGYGIAVNYAYERLQPQEDDIIVWYTKQQIVPHVKSNDIVIDKSKISVFKRIGNVIRCNPSTQLNSNDLKFLKKYDFEHIHCDEILFFKALRELFPDKHITVRLHNNFARIYTRYTMLRNVKIDWKFKLILHLCKHSEKYIMNDRNSYKIFLTDEDRDYYTQVFGIQSDSEVWAFKPDELKMTERRRKLSLSKRLIWFGGLDAHKTSSVIWFVNEVFLPLREDISDLEFHLWGRGTQKLNDPVNGIYGHGFFEGENFPDYESLYINPDLLGGGIKLKLLTYLNEGIPFISTQYGFEGYSEKLIDEEFCIVKAAPEWKMSIYNILKKHEN